MKKTILASAIAAATFSGAAFAQETLSASEMAAKMDSMPTVYGNIQYVVKHTNFDNGPSEIEHADNGSTLGVKHDHEIAPGLTGFFKAELEYDADDKEGNNGLDSFDEAYIGVDSDNFGKVWIGSDDSTYESAIDEIYNFWEVGSGIGGDYETGEGDLVQYQSPSFSGLTLGAAVQVNGDGDNDQKSYPYQLAAMYEVDALELAFAVDSNDGEGSNENTYGLRASYNLDNLRLTGSFETRKDEQDVFGVMSVYTLGANQFALAYQLEDRDNGDKKDVVSLQALHNLSDNMYIYAEGYFGGGDDNVWQKTDDKDNVVAQSDERTVAAVGAVYYF
jgi:predicted porin